MYISSRLHASTLRITVAVKGEQKNRCEHILKLCDQAFIYRTSSFEKEKKKLKDKNNTTCINYYSRKWDANRTLIKIATELVTNSLDRKEMFPRGLCINSYTDTRVTK